MKPHSDELAVFVQVVESGSFSRAAERLGLANSAVSRTVKRLEDKLSANLLNRTTRQLRLTEEGCRFFERARQILHDIEAAEAEILSAGGAPQGVLRVDSATPTLLHLVAPLVRPFCERYPQVSLLLTSSEGYIDLIERRVDIAIRAGSLHGPGASHRTGLFRDLGRRPGRVHRPLPASRSERSRRRCSSSPRPGCRPPA